MTAAARRQEGGLAAETVELASAFCAIRSVAGDEGGLAAMAAALTDFLTVELGAEIVTAGQRRHPAVVHARLDAGRPTTVILYNMYDVMPADDVGWCVDPFGGGIVDLPDVGEAFVARGAENNKGPLAGMLVALRALGPELPVNVEIVVEGEEESGSGALRAYLAAEDCPLRPARAAMFPSFCENGGGPPRVYLGFSGIAKGTIRVAGGGWGGPLRAIHSSNAAWIASPAFRLAEVLTALVEAPTGLVSQIALGAEERHLVEALAATFAVESELAFRDTLRAAVAGDAAAILTRMLASISLNVAWLDTDPHRGDAAIPSAASAGFDLRTPPGVVVEDALVELRSRLDAARLEGVAIDVASVSRGHAFGRHAPGVDELVGVYASAGRPPQVWPWAPGSAPAAAFAQFAPSFLIGGLGRGGNAHGTDEFATLAGLEPFVASIMGWLAAMGGRDPPPRPAAFKDEPS